MIDPKQLEDLKAKARAAQEAGRLSFKVPLNAPQAWIDYFDAFRTSTILSLIAELEQARKYAERYRWLRHGDNDELVLQNGPVDMSYWYLPRKEKLDEMIDAALSAQEGK